MSTGLRRRGSFRWRPRESPRPDTEGGGGVHWGQIFAIFTLVGMVSVLPSVISHLNDGEQPPWSRIASELIGWYAWALLVPVILWLVRRYPLDVIGLRRGLPIYFLFSATIALLYGLFDTVKASVFFMIATGRRGPTVGDLGWNYLLGGIQFYLLVSWLLLAVLHAFEYHRRYRDRDVRAAQLETQLTQARLQVLRGQLNPHFLFNALNAISSLMHKDVDAADRMIVQLSDFLRLSLDSGEFQEVTLGEELDILDHYVEIERTRFGDRLEVEVDVEDGLMDTLVPTLVLQPLVENAIRHGVSMRSAPGRIEVRARPQFPGRLELRVADNGVGLRQEVSTVLKPGVGLHNTMRRLEQLYGDDQRFEIGNAPGGGFQVTIEFPLRRPGEGAEADDGLFEDGADAVGS